MFQIDQNVYLLIRERESIQWEQYSMGFGAYLERRDRFFDGHIEVFIKFRTGNTCVRAAQRPETVQVLRPEHPAHGGVMLSTVQCRPATARARKSPPRVHSKETRQDKTRHSTTETRPQGKNRKA